MQFYSAKYFRKGSELSPTDKAYVLRAYVHRYTGSHTPTWARGTMQNGQPYPLQFANDADWLANTLFAVTKSGKLDRRVTDCRSTPTWPNNPELRK
jgi:hypothetical protein